MDTPLEMLLSDAAGSVRVGRLPACTFTHARACSDMRSTVRRVGIGVPGEPVASEDNFVQIDANSSFEKLNGLWFLVTYGATAAVTEPRPVIAKHQVGRKTIKRIDAGELATVTKKLYWNRVKKR